MKILRWILTSLLAIVLIFSAPLSYAQTIAPPSSTFQIPNSDQVVRHIKRIGVYALVLDFAVKQLVEAVDWVLEPENNRVRYTDKFKNEKIYSSSHIKLGMSEYIDSEDFDYIAHYSCQNGHSSNRVYSGQFSQTSHSVNIECIWADTGYPAGTAIFYKHDKPQYIPLNIIAQQIITNAQNGHQSSIDFLKDVADDVAKQSVSNEAESDTQSTENTPSDQTQDPTDKPNDRPVKTGNPDLDDVFKDAYPTDDGKKGYHLPNKTQAELIEELEKIKGAEKKLSKDGKANTIQLNDGKKVVTYPARTSTENPGWEIHITPTSYKPKYKGDTVK